MALYCQEKERIDHMIRSVFFGKKLMIGYVSGASYTQKALNIKLVNASLTRALSQRTPFEVQIFSLPWYS